MAKYKLTESGVLDTETGANIPNAEGNRHWQEYQEWLAEPNTPDPMDVVDPWLEIRSQRDALLTTCDWTQLPDAPLTAQQVTDWQTYRSDLRDIPQTYAGNPAGIVWPTEPAQESNE